MEKLTKDVNVNYATNFKQLHELHKNYVRTKAYSTVEVNVSDSVELVVAPLTKHTIECTAYQKIQTFAY